ncbi:MAG: helix-turn-helix domain-containing protein [Thiohalocapsa sp.]
METSFGDLAEQTRRELIENCLRDPRLSMTEIAFRTGFSTHSGFSNAVRRWTGMAPSAYRKQLIGTCL